MVEIWFGEYIKAVAVELQVKWMVGVVDDAGKPFSVEGNSSPIGAMLLSKDN